MSVKMSGMAVLATKWHLRHKLLLMIGLSLSVYTIITSESMASLLSIGWAAHRLWGTPDDSQLIAANWERRRGVRTTDRMGHLLYYHLPNLTDYHIIYYYKPITMATTAPDGDDHQQYCLTMGTDWNRTVTGGRCVCANGYSGPDCGVPPLVTESLQRMDQLLNSSSNSSSPIVQLKRLSKPKRLVLSVILYTSDGYHQLVPSTDRLLNSTLESLSHFVDLFIITRIHLMDSKSSECVDNNCGQTVNHIKDDIKDMLTSKANKYSDLVLYSTVNVTAKQLATIGANGLHMYAMSKVWTISMTRVTDFRPNDVMIYMSVNTLPDQKIVMFLKHYTGFAEPIKLVTHSAANSSPMNNLFAKQLVDPLVTNNNRLVNIAVTFEYLTILCRYDFKLFKTNLCLNNKAKVKKFNETYWPIRYWLVGDHRPNGSANVLLPYV